MLILVAEDDKFLASAYRLKLSKQGWEVVIVGDGGEAIEFLKKKCPDFILLDLIMPNIDGFEVLEFIAKSAKCQGVPTVVASNLGQKEDIDRAMSLGAADFVVKSEMSLDSLVIKIQTMVKKK